MIKIKKTKEESRWRRVMLAVALVLIAVSIINAFIMITLTGMTVDGSGQVGMCINHPPTIQAISNQSVGFNSLFTLQVNATDSDNHSLVYYDNASLFNISNSTGLINFTTIPSQWGNHSISITVRDYTSGCPVNVSTAFNLSIFNLPPVLQTAIPNLTWEEDLWLTGLDLDNYFSDPDNDNLTYTSIQGSNVTVSISNSTGWASIKPQTDWSGISWVIFTANDTRATTNSNNVTLNITQVANYCGDNVCNSNESCSDCVTDCGVCPAGTGSSSSGGGGGGRNWNYRIIDEKLIEVEKDAICKAQTTCTAWDPVVCTNSATQNKSCITVSQNCKVTEVTSERDCECVPQWECTIWSECTENETKARTCTDKNNCGQAWGKVTIKECAYTGKKEAKINALALVGKAFFQKLGSGGNLVGKAFWQKLAGGEKYGPYWLIFLEILLITTIWWKYHGRRKKAVVPDNISFKVDLFEINVYTLVEVNRRGKIHLWEAIKTSQDKEFRLKRKIE